MLDNLFKSFNLNPNETLVVDNWDYLVKAVDIYATYAESDKKRTLQNLIIFNFLDYFISALPIKYLDAKMNVLKVNSKITLSL